MPRRKAVLEQIDETTTAPILTETPMPAETIEAPATESKIVKVKGERLSGDELLAFVKENKDEPIDDVVFRAGFYTRSTDAETGETKTTLHKPQFFQALTVASTGVEFAPPKRSYAARKGRKPVITVVKNGNIVVGSRHGSVAGFEPGSKVRVESEYGKITLTAWQDEDGGDDDADEDLDL